MLEAYEVAADAFTTTAQERVLEPESFWQQRIAGANGLSVAYGAFINGQLVGSVALELSAKPKIKHKAHVIGMYVKGSARGYGAGQGLLQALISHARSNLSIRQLFLTVTQGNEPALKLYRNAGFEVFGTEPAAILTPTGYQAKVHMWLPLL